MPINLLHVAVDRLLQLNFDKHRQLRCPVGVLLADKGDGLETQCLCDRYPHFQEPGSHAREVEYAHLVPC